MVLVRKNRAAVPVGDGRRAVTTAEALSIHEVLQVQIGDGSPVAATVRSIDRAADFAVLDLANPATGATRRIAAARPNDGDRVTLGGAHTAVVHKTPTGFVVDTDTRTAQGAPVLDMTGALVGLTSTGDDGVIHLVMIPGSATFESTPLVADVWLGLRFDGDALVVNEVQPGAPAALSGVVSGDKVIAIDGRVLRTIDDLWTVLARHEPDDAVELTVKRGSDQIGFDVILGTPPS